MDIITDDAIDPAPLAGKRIAIIGYGNQGRAQALNLADSGMDVVVGLREGSATVEQVRADGLTALPLEQAPRDAALTMMLVPDELMTGIYGLVEPALERGSALGFSHGLAVHFNHVRPRADLDVLLVAPKGPGTALRQLHTEGKGMPALWAVAEDRSGKARQVALAYGQAIGCARAGLIASSFEEECVADLFNEQAVVWGGVPALLLAGYETLVETGYSEEVAYFECVRELKLLADLIEARGIAGMREVISNTAELGAVLGGPAVIDHHVRARMRDIMTSVRGGEFAAQLAQEAAEGYPLLTKARERARAHRAEAVRQRLEEISPTSASSSTS
ncbi:ketol-acid reductoisomerase [Sphingomicrobium astaxanthinifaciens]|uniref:ketol-acid reductoisomerase n=1 Tax=Sphingomicrobium astaxanthinifaciens TaxID=1227949 RepID=UPI001FCC4CA8|nr:ketol-acid reductoisomerase [Sphingomicrobium astaxanthinifaciens]MCJ7420285.1 ketol-acid reductoisomerase [Sphingomicrobium astaxanthinifaciens]